MPKPVRTTSIDELIDRVIRDRRLAERLKSQNESARKIQAGTKDAARPAEVSDEWENLPV